MSITEKVKQVTGHDVQLWSTVYSAGFGTITWTAWFEDLAALEVIGVKLRSAGLGTRCGDPTESAANSFLTETR
jgi:hypothetical protein